MPRHLRQRQTLILMTALAAFSLSACANVKIPKLDLIKLPDFKAESEKLGEFPELADAPDLPEEVRNARQWDKTARDIIKIRDNFRAPIEPDRPKTAKEINREVNRLTREVNEYRADDPPAKKKK